MFHLNEKENEIFCPPPKKKKHTPVPPPPPTGKFLGTPLDLCPKKTQFDSSFLKGKFSSGREGALASKFNYDFK